MRKTPRTLGILSIIFGSLIAVWSLISIALAGMGNSMMSAMSSLPHRPGTPDPGEMMTRMQGLMHELAPYTYGLLIGRLAFSIALVVIGYGLYKQQRWGRSGAIAWGALALLFLVAEISINVGVIQPRTMAILQQMFAEMPNGGGPQASMMNAMKGMQGSVTVFFSLLFYAPFPIVMLVLNGRRSAAADFVD